MIKLLNFSLFLAQQDFRKGAVFLAILDAERERVQSKLQSNFVCLEDDPEKI